MICTAKPLKLNHIALQWDSNVAFVIKATASELVIRQTAGHKETYCLPMLSAAGGATDGMADSAAA